MDCQNRVKTPSFVHYGTGLPGCSFFALDREIPEASPIPSLSNVGIISVQDKRVSPQILLDELKVWDEGGWDWQIRQLSEFEFAATFPSKESLQMISSCSSFTLPLNRLVVSVKAASNGSKSISSLSDVWVLVEDVPPSMRTSAFLMAFGVLIGKPIEVDQESLAILGPARLRIWCVDPLCIHGSLDVFPVAGGFRLRVRVEGASGPVSPPPPPPPPASDNGDKSKEGDGCPEDSLHGSDPRFTQSEWDGLSPKDQDMLKENAPAGKGVQGSAPDLGGGEAAADGAKGTPFSTVCSNLPACPASPSLSGIEDLPPTGTAALKEKKKSFVKKFSAKSHASGDSRQSAAGLCRRLEADLGLASGPSSAAASPSRARPVPVRSPASTACKSGRVSNSGKRVVDRAARRAAARDLPPAGSSSPPSPSPPHPRDSLSCPFSSPLSI